MGMPGVVDQAAGRFRDDDDADDLTPTWLANQDINIMLAPSVEFRVRFGIQETGGNPRNNFSVQLEYNHAGGGWNDVTASSSVVQAVASAGGRSDGDDCDQNHITGMTGTQDTTNAGFDAADGACGGAGQDVPANGFVEVEFNLIGIDADVSDTQVTVLRCKAMDSYTRANMGVQWQVTATPSDQASPGIVHRRNAMSARLRR